MDTDDLVAAAATELETLIEAVGAGPTSAAVPTCEGWTVADLAAHVGNFLAFWSHDLCEGTGRPKTPFEPLAEGADAAIWLRQVGDHLLGELRATPAGTPVWTWFEPDQTAGFVARRVANELAVHRYDAQAARGTCSPIPAALAVDGIDELFGRLTGARPRTGTAIGQTLHVHGTDVDGAEWLVTLLPDRIDMRREHAKGDLALRGAVSDLELLLYDRPTLAPVERLGDGAALAAWFAEFRF